MTSDPVSDLATRMRNALSVEASFVDIPSSKFGIEIAAALQREGFIWDYEAKLCEGTAGSILRVNLKYGPSGERVLRSIQRVSRPGRRIYFGLDEMPKVLGGLGVLLLSTNRGVLSSREALDKHVGGEALLEIW